jgi:hypothetical protein
MFAKIFDSVFSSTVNEEPLHVRWLWIALLTIPDSDDGIVDRTPESLARYANLPLDQTVAAIAALEAPDPRSRSSEEEGRRIMKIRDGYGWRIVNFKKYRGLKRAEDRRVYQRELMRQRRTKRAPVSTPLAPVSKREKLLGRLADTEAEAEAEAEAETETEKNTRASARAADAARMVVFEDLWKQYPRKKKKPDALRHFRASVKTEDDVASIRIALANALQEFGSRQMDKIPYGGTWFNGWLEYVEPDRKPRERGVPNADLERQLNQLPD